MIQQTGERCEVGRYGFVRGGVVASGREDDGRGGEEGKPGGQRKVGALDEAAEP